MQQSSWIFLNGELWILWDSSCVAQLCSQSLQQPTWSCQLCSSGLDGWTGEADWRDPTARYLAADTRERSPCARDRSTQRAHFMVEPSPRWLTRSWTVKAQHQRRRTGHSRSTAGAQEARLAFFELPGDWEETQKDMEAVRWCHREEQTRGHSSGGGCSEVSVACVTSQRAYFPELCVFGWHFGTTGPSKRSKEWTLLNYW